MAEQSDNKISTYIVRNTIIMTLCSFLFFFSVFLIKTFYFTYPIGDDTKIPMNGFWALLITVVFFLPIVISAVARASRVKTNLSISDYTNATKFSNKCKKLYKLLRNALVLLCILTVLLAIYAPSWVAYQQRVIDSDAKRSIDSLTEAQKQYHSNHKSYTKIPEELVGWGAHPQVEVTILEADTNCWKATAKHKKSLTIFVYDHCGGGLKKSEP